MNKIIGTDAAKLAGLQIDTLQKYRAGQLSLEHWERFINMTPEIREERFGTWRRHPVLADLSAPVVTSPVEKFTLLADLGIITVSEAVSLDKFRTKNERNFYYHDENITDANFSNPSRILKPGDRLTVRAFKQVVPRTTSEERMKFLAEQKSVLTGAQGAALVFDQKRDQLPKGFWYASMDQKDRLWEDADRYRRVPEVYAYSVGGFSFNLGHFEHEWYDFNALLVFCDLPSGT
jgi:hypothetical protein